MEQRTNKRGPANFRTEIIYNGQLYHGVIDNLSASGARIVTDQIDNAVDFHQYDPVALQFKSASGEEFNIKCTIMWADYIPPQNVRCRIGLELIGKPWDAIAQFL